MSDRNLAQTMGADEPLELAWDYVEAAQELTTAVSDALEHAHGYDDPLKMTAPIRIALDEARLLVAALEALHARFTSSP